MGWTILSSSKLIKTIKPMVHMLGKDEPDTFNQTQEQIRQGD